MAQSTLSKSRSLSLDVLVVRVHKLVEKNVWKSRFDQINSFYRILTSPSDLKERAFWGDYQEAYEDAINRCTTDYAPWHVVPANRKWARDLAVIEFLFRILRKMDPQYPKPTFDPKTCGPFDQDSPA
jgi:polyphosphate kinase 2 (PPK2 family)